MAAERRLFIPTRRAIRGLSAIPGVLCGGYFVWLCRRNLPPYQPFSMSAMAVLWYIFLVTHGITILLFLDIPSATNKGETMKAAYCGTKPFGKVTLYGRSNQCPSSLFMGLPMTGITQGLVY